MVGKGQKGFICVFWLEARAPIGVRQFRIAHNTWKVASFSADPRQSQRRKAPTETRRLDCVAPPLRLCADPRP